MHNFEEAMCFHFVRDPLVGVFVSIEPDALVSMERFVSICKQDSLDPEV